MSDVDVGGIKKIINLWHNVEQLKVKSEIFNKLFDYNLKNNRVGTIEYILAETEKQLETIDFLKEQNNESEIKI